MAQTLEAFVERLRADGVEAGREEAEKLLADADRRAQQLIADAEKQAAKIVAGAEAESERIRERSSTELALAGRDTLNQLRDALGRALSAVLVGGVRSKLEDAEFLSGLIREVVLQYAASDLAGESTMTLNVSDEMRSRLADWAIQTFHKDPQQRKFCVDLRGTLAEAGFSYRLGDGTVEVTTESVVAVLSELVSPELRRIVASGTVT